ncbi:MAG: hypothetical protein ABEI52_01680, partial [Halobacteriaceae archaeon]
SELLERAAAMYGYIDTGKSLYSAVDDALLGAHLHSKATLSLSGVFVGTVVGMSSDYVEGWFRKDAMISGAHHAYNTARIAGLDTLQVLEIYAMSNALAPADIVRYHLHEFALSQMRALTYDYSAGVYRKMADNQVFTLMVNAAERRDTHNHVANGSRRRAYLELVALGASYKDARDRMKASINAEQLGGA